METVAVDEDLDDVGLEGLGADGAVLGLCRYGDCAAKEECFAGAECGWSVGALGG
jgi:hypothetical protein